MNPVSEHRPERVVETAPAKINLALHVTGRRFDGYHLLDSLVTFAEDGDELVFEASDSDSFRVIGRFGSELSEDCCGRPLMKTASRTALSPSPSTRACRSLLALAEAPPMRQRRCGGF
jgi:hypothetical protein